MKGKVDPVAGTTVATIFAGWFLLALFVGETELLGLLPGRGVQGVLLTITMVLLVSVFAVNGFRAWVENLDLRMLIAVHLARFVGIWFLVLHERGELAGEFAVKAGWGDIIVAAGAVGLLCIPGMIRRRGVVLGWNLVGLADILMVIGTAGKLMAEDPFSLEPLLRLPLSFLPTLVVPLIISTHVIIFVRLYKTGTNLGGRKKVANTISSQDHFRSAGRLQ